MKCSSPTPSPTAARLCTGTFKIRRCFFPLPNPMSNPTTITVDLEHASKLKAAGYPQDLREGSLFWCMTSAVYSARHGWRLAYFGEGIVASYSPMETHYSFANGWRE